MLIFQDGIFLSRMFGRFHSPQTNCSSRSEQAAEQRRGALQEKTASRRRGEAFFFAFFFLCPSWHRNGLVGRKRESERGGGINDEKVYSTPFIKYMERTREAHLDSICAPLMASSVLFPDHGAGSFGMSMAARSSVDSCHLNTATHPHHLHCPAPSSPSSLHLHHQQFSCSS